ncbi:type-F conjugative transfer system pilin acetylase TraX [Escherichia coli]|nr:type-F conjugative transfer system pilin acetylase TraX [Escherichia coli]
MTTDNTNTTRNDSLAARTDTWLQSLLVWSPGQRDIIKTVALVLMVLDHANRILHLDQSWMFLVGRGAFPLFALVWGLNLSRHTHIRQEAINRLWGWAVIAQFAYYLAGFPWYEGNILFAFAVAAQVLTWCETRTWWRSAETMLLLAMWLPFSGTSYGIAGLLMLAVSHRLYRAEDRMERLALVACLLAVIPALNLATSDAAAVTGLIMHQLDERIPAVLTALFTRELNADEVISQIARITGWKPSSGDLKEVLKALGGLQSTVSPEHSQDDGEQARLKAARVKMQNLI